MYGSSYQTYGARECSTCGQFHGASHSVKETPASRFKLMQLVAELQLAPVFAKRLSQAAPEQNADRMFGILITPEKVFATHSGELLGGQSPFLKAAKIRGYTLCLTEEEKQSQHTAVSGTLKQHEYQKAKVANAYKPGNCAAPRLLEAALEDKAVSKDFRKWAMSEVMYNPSGSNNQWWHGLTAHSCATCEKLVPMLLCPHGSGPLFGKLFD